MSLKIRSISDINRKEVETLKVKENQLAYIESVKKSLEEADELSLWKRVAIYDNHVLIGFAMYGLFEREGINGRVWLDRFLIDKRYQHQGYGEKALILLLKRLKEEYLCDLIYLSVFDDNERAITLYKKHGFVFNGELDIHNEKIMVCEI